jgi:type I restriction enzyme S subunit
MTWIATTLGEVLQAEGGSIKTGPFGTTLKASEYSETGVPVISVGEVGCGSLRLRKDTPRVSAETTSRLPEYVLQADDIVFGRKGAVDRNALIKPEENGWFLGSDGIRVRLPRGVVPRFISYQLQLDATKDWLLQHAAGSTMLSLNQGILERVPMSFPPVREQQAIIEVLGALDDKIAANTRLAGIAEALADETYKIIVQAAESKPFSEVLEPVLGGTPARSNSEFWNGDALWCSAKDITGAPWGIVIDTEEKITATAVGKTRAKALPAGSVILTARGTVGAVARLGRAASFNQSCYGFAPGALPASVLYFTVKDAAQKARSLAHGSVFDTITMKSFDHLYIPDLGPAEIEKLESEIAPLLDVVTMKVNENETLGRTRDSLLPQLMSGKLPVTEAEDMVRAVV